MEGLSASELNRNAISGRTCMKLLKKDVISNSGNYDQPVGNAQANQTHIKGTGRQRKCPRNERWLTAQLRVTRLNSSRLRSFTLEK